jgi:hypothetical protein
MSAETRKAARRARRQRQEYEHARPSIVQAALDTRAQIAEHLRDTTYLSTVVLPYSVEMNGADTVHVVRR